MGYLNKSRLKSKTIKKTWLNKKNYKFLDFDFKIELPAKDKYNLRDYFYINVFNCGTKILGLEVYEDSSINDEERFTFKVRYFNPQTDNDCHSINHIIAVCSESITKDEKHKDMGNAEIIRNQFIFRKRSNYYTYTKIWARGEIKEDNYDKQFSYEFATDEYLRYVKKIFEMEKLQRRKIKKHFKGFLDKIIILDKL